MPSMKKVRGENVVRGGVKRLAGDHILGEKSWTPKRKGVPQDKEGVLRGRKEWPVVRRKAQKKNRGNHQSQKKERLATKEKKKGRQESFWEKKVIIFIHGEGWNNAY